jgi:hypothetical protein
MEKILHPAFNIETTSYGWRRVKYSFNFANYFDTSREKTRIVSVLDDVIFTPLKTGLPTDTPWGYGILKMPQYPQKQTIAFYL